LRVADRDEVEIGGRRISHPFTVTAMVERRGDYATLPLRNSLRGMGLKDPSILFFKVEKNVSVEFTATAHISDATDCVTWPRAPPGARSRGYATDRK
jgi:hypothetical protein